MLVLWKFNKVTGYWVFIRQCDESEAEEWQRIFSADEPTEYFYLTGGRKPKHNPIPKEY